jgi:hypothetical protein
MQVGRDNWILDITGDWSLTEHPECLTLELENNGALQFSSATRSSGPVDDTELWRVANRFNDGWGAPESASCGEFSGYVYNYAGVDGSIWRRWFMGCQSTLLFVTYNAEYSIAEQEEELIRNALCTLRLLSQQKKTESLIHQALTAVRTFTFGRARPTK